MAFPVAAPHWLQCRSCGSSSTPHWVQNMLSGYRKSRPGKIPVHASTLSRRGHYRGYYDQELIDGVADLYRRDLELFGYEF